MPGCGIWQRFPFLFFVIFPSVEPLRRRVMDSAERDEIHANIPLFLRRPGQCDTHQGYSYLSCLSNSLVPHPYLTVTSSHKQIETTNTLSSHSDEINEPACKLSGQFCFGTDCKRSTSSAVQVRPANTEAICTAGLTSFSHDGGFLL